MTELTDEQIHAISHAQKVLRAVKLYDQAALLSASKPAAQGVPVDFKEWFELEWAAYEDKAFTSRVTSMAWAMKAWRHVKASQITFDCGGVMGIPPRVQKILGDPNGTVIVRGWEES